MTLTKKFKNFLLLFLFSVLFLVVYFTNSYLSKNKTVEVPKVFKSTEKEVLKFPFEYLPEADWGGGTEEEASFSGEIEARSYPTMKVTIPKDLYSNIKQKEQSSSELLKNGYEITNTLYFDVDKDGKKEKIISMCSIGANHCPDKQLVIKNGDIIFSLFGKLIGGWVESTATGNGFYANWYADEDFSSGLCCATGYTRTRFIYKDNIFVPIFEQKIEYVKVKNDK